MRIYIYIYIYIFAYIYIYVYICICIYIYIWSRDLDATRSRLTELALAAPNQRARRVLAPDLTIRTANHSLKAASSSLKSESLRDVIRKIKRAPSFVRIICRSFCCQ